MAAWEVLKNSIAALLPDNDNNEISAEDMRTVCESIIDNIGGATYKGVAETNTEPGVLGAAQFYITGLGGTYSNFGLTIPTDTQGFFILYSAGGAWEYHTVLTNFATLDNLTQLALDVFENRDSIADNSTAIATNAQGIANNAQGISSNAQGVADNGTAIATNAQGIASNAEGVAYNAGSISDLSADLGATAIKVATNENNIAQNATNIAANTAAIEGLEPGGGDYDQRITDNETNIAQNATDIAANTAAISSIESGGGATIQMDDVAPLPEGEYYTLYTAMLAIPTALRKVGMLMTFFVADRKKETWQFLKSDAGYAEFANEWKRVDDQFDTRVLHELELKKTVANFLIADNGGYFAYDTNARVDSFEIKGGSKLQIETGCIFTPVSFEKHGYAFYSGEPSAATFISGSGATTGTIRLNDLITAPTNATHIAISRYTDYRSVVSSYEQLDTLKVNEVNNYYDNDLQVINYASSTLGNFSTGDFEGITQAEAEDAFAGFWCNYDGNIRTYGINYNAGLRLNTVTFKSEDLTSFEGAVYCNFDQDFYSLHSIYNITNSIYPSTVTGYVLLKPSAFKRKESGLYFYATFNNSLSHYREFVGKKLEFPSLVSCIGDSETALGSGYSGHLKIPAVAVNSHGSGGETPQQIMGRYGFVPYEVATDITIPATTTPIDLPLISSWDGNVNSPNNDFGFGTCRIRGVEGSISIVTTGVLCTFTRLEAGDEVLVKAGETLIPYAPANCWGGAILLLMGENGGYVDSDELVNMYRVCAKRIGHNNYIFMTTHNGTDDDLESKMAKEFGLNYINIRKWGITNGLEDTGITPTQADLDAIALGNFPPSLMSDYPIDIHLSEDANKSLAQVIMARLYQLGVIQYDNKW